MLLLVFWLYIFVFNCRVLNGNEWKIFIFYVDNSKCCVVCSDDNDIWKFIFKNIII